MPWGLKRYQNTGALHFIIFSCYRRQPLLMKHSAAQMFEQALEGARQILWELKQIAFGVVTEG